MLAFRHPDALAFSSAKAGLSSCPAGPCGDQSPRVRRQPGLWRGWISLAMPGRLMRSLQMFGEWFANLSYAMIPVLDGALGRTELRNAR